MIMVELRFIHYSPKDSESGLKTLLLADNEEQVTDYVNAECLCGELDEDDSSPSSTWPTEEWWESHPEKEKEAKSLGLEVDETGEVAGTSRSITLWLGSTTWQEVEETYYGVTQWDWSHSRKIAPDQANVLLDLGLATDLRGKPTTT